ncbi:MAG TPA: 4Fe-4S binding protein [Gammaproteobacteria bacterium]|nr:4Fe-4S binding protein [Gammaproteobacteria bacterium]
MMPPAAHRLLAAFVCAVLLAGAGPAAGVAAAGQPPAGIEAADPDVDDADDGGWNFDDEELADPTLLELAADQALDIGLFAAFAALAMISFLRKSIPLKYVTLVVSVVYMGAMKSQLMSVVNIFGALTANLPIFSYSMAWYAFAVFTVVTTVLWGRVYCGRICAFGALTQLIDAVVPRRFQFEVPVWLERRASVIKYCILFGAIGYFLVTREIAFYRYIEPFWIFTFEASTALWVGVALLLIASIFVRNLYCRFLCPLGAALGIMSKLTVFRIKRWSECSTCALCEKKCEWGAIQERKIVMTECVRCDECEILYASKSRCPHWLLAAKRARLASRTQSESESESA